MLRPVLFVYNLQHKSIPWSEPHVVADAWTASLGTCKPLCHPPAFRIIPNVGERSGIRGCWLLSVH